jgi:HSP20 family protein
MSQRNSSDWMWARACELLEEAERMHRQFFRLAASAQSRLAWEPPVDVFEDEREFIVIVALPGVPAERAQVAIEAGVLVVRAERSIPFAGPACALRRLEIPYGYFERRIALPEQGLQAGTREFIDGCLILRLRKSAVTDER